jgi:hypothetical protein
MEAIQYGVERGMLERRDGNWHIVDLEAFIECITQRNAVEARLKALSPAAQKFLLALAATGVPLSRAEVDDAIDSGTVSPDTLMELERRGYIQPRGDRWDLAYNDVEAALGKLVGEGERRSIHAALGRGLLARNPNDRTIVMRAARHMVQGGHILELKGLFRRWVASARKTGDRTAVSEMAREFLGDDNLPDQVQELVHAVPISDRYPVAKPLVLVLLAFGILVLVLGLLLA